MATLSYIQIGEDRRTCDYSAFHKALPKPAFYAALFLLLVGCGKYERFNVGDKVEFRTPEMVGTGVVLEVEEWVEGRTTVPYCRVEGLSSDENLVKDSAYFHPGLLRRVGR